MHIRIDPNSRIPLGVQIVRGIRLAIAQGRIGAGAQLPSARELSMQLQVNFHTVRKAFGELRDAGVLEFRRGRGTFVAADAGQLPTAELSDLVQSHIDRLIEDLAGTDWNQEQLLELVARALSQATRKEDS